MIEGRYPVAPKRYTDPKYGFTFQYPLVRHWKLDKEKPGFIQFVNPFLSSILRVSAWKNVVIIKDVHAIRDQETLVKELVRKIKLAVKSAAHFNYSSAAKIRNPHNRIKGFKVRITFKTPDHEMQAKSIFYVKDMTRYQILAWTATQHFDTEDQVFFEPVAKSFTFEEKIPDFSALGDRLFGKK